MPKVSQSGQYGRVVENRNVLVSFSLYSVTTTFVHYQIRFDNLCNQILNSFSKKWYSNLRSKYEKNFSISKVERVNAAKYPNSKKHSQENPSLNTHEESL